MYVCTYLIRATLNLALFSSLDVTATFSNIAKNI